MVHQKINNFNNNDKGKQMEKLNQKTKTQVKLVQRKIL